MLLLFSTYLEKHNIKLQHLYVPRNRVYHINAWLEQLCSTIATVNEYLPQAYEALEHHFRAHIIKCLEEDWSNNAKKKVAEVDRVARFFYMKIIDYAIAKSHKKPLKAALGYYPYEAQHVGVSISAYIVQETVIFPPINSKHEWEACDYLAHKNKNSNLQILKNKILTGINTPAMPEPSKQLSLESKTTIRNRVQHSHFHAEELWFSTQFHYLVNYLEKHQNTLVMSRVEDDEIWIKQLKAKTRIEFIVTSTPCTDCQKLFKDLRKILNALGIIIPIIIFSNSTTNTVETEYSQIAIIGFNGEYFNTGLVGKAPYTEERFSNHYFTNMHGLFNKDTQIFNRFEPIISQIMPTMIVASERARNDFIDDLFRFFGHSSIINGNALPWFIHFLNRLPTNKDIYSLAFISDLDDGELPKANKIYVAIEDNKIKYRVINPEGLLVTDIIEASELSVPHISTDLIQLHQLLTKILLIASSKGNIHKDFYTSQKMNDTRPIDHIPSAYEAIVRVLPKTRVEMFLNPTEKSKKIDFLNPGNRHATHMNTKPQPFQYIESKFKLLIAPYVENNGIRTLHDHIHSRLESFYIKDKEESLPNKPTITFKK